MVVDEDEIAALQREYPSYDSQNANVEDYVEVDEHNPDPTPWAAEENPAEQNPDPTPWKTTADAAPAPGAERKNPDPTPWLKGKGDNPDPTPWMGPGMGPANPDPTPWQTSHRETLAHKTNPDPTPW